MRYDISITADAERQFRNFAAREQRLLEAAIQTRLQYQPTIESNSIKRLRPNKFAAFELRVGDLRVLYNVEDDEVVLLLFGRKVGNTLIVENEEFREHQDDKTE